MLNISSDDTPVIPTMGVDLEELTEVLRQNITLPVGKIKRLKAIGKFSIFIFIFNTKTKCSEAKEGDFFNVNFPTIKELKLPPLSITRNVAWSFFTLNEDITDDLTKSFCYPKPSFEEKRMYCLQTTIMDQYKLKSQHAPAKVEKIDPKTQTNGYCQFSGGGDLCLYSNSQTLVVKGLTDENDEKNDDGGLSPIYNGDSISTTISIEGKRGECSYEKLTSVIC